jgi:hypothetical protein
MKVGDVVICIDSNASFNKLREGGTYTVGKDSLGRICVCIDSFTFALSRFRKPVVKGGKL